MSSLPRNSGGLESLTIKFSGVPDPVATLADLRLRSLHLIQCPTPLPRLLALLPSFPLVSLSLVNLGLRQAHLRCLLGLSLPALTQLDVSMNRQLGDLGLSILLESEVGARLRVLRVGGPDSGCGMTNGAIAILLQNAGQMGDLEVIDLSWNSINDEGYKLLRLAFEKVHSLVQIDLSRTAI